MPYGDLEAQRAQRFASLEDLDAAGVTIEEREEYEPTIRAGHVVYAGVDYADILERAQAEADVIVWDGGNNDLPFYAPTVHVVVVDPLRAGHERRYHPGEANVRMAAAIVINKVDSAEPDQIAAVEASVRELNPAATIVKARSPIVVEGNGSDLRGRRVLVVEDGPTLTHGDMAYGAGVLAAKEAGAELIDPRPFAVGSIRDTFEKYSGVGPLLPAMGYSPKQRSELAQTINAAGADAVLIATPIDLRKVVEISVPAYRVSYELEEVGSPTLVDVLRPVTG
jgi:predicted GTPase